LNQCLITACVALVIFQFSSQGVAQFTDPRNYSNSPIGLNQLELNYAYVHANSVIDTSLIVTGASLNLNQGTIDYTRYFGCFHRLTWVEAAVPLAGVGGSVSGTKIHASTTGAGDSSYSVAMLLKGGPAKSVEEFKDYKPNTTLGVSLSVTAPTGLYHSNKILNLGSDRWSFKPEIALSHPFGPEQKWEVDGYFNVYFYTDNTSYRGREVLGQDPLPGIEGHLSYTFNDRIWASLDTRYSFRGTTLLDGNDQNNAQRNFIIGDQLNLALNDRHALVFEYGKALVHHNGPSISGLSVRYVYIWGKSLSVNKHTTPNR
jgi:hypothetical protein